MKTITKKITVKGTPAKAFKVISDFASYPDFVDEVVSAKVEKKTKTGATVAFVMQMIKSVKVRLKFKFHGTDEISWELVEGDMMRSNSGSWRIKKTGAGKIELTYSVTIEFGLFVPSSIAETLIKNDLPKMLSVFKKRIESN